MDTFSYSFLLSNDDCFINLDTDNNVVLKITKSGEQIPFFDTSHLFPIKVGEGLNGNILVSKVDQLLGTRTEQSIRRVQMITPKGMIQHTYELGEDGATPILTLPKRAVQNYNSTVCIVNKFEEAPNKKVGNLCVFYEDGAFKSFYNGHGRDFNPRDVCCDTMSNILLLNPADDTIHLLNSDGAFLKHLFIKDKSPQHLMCITLYKDTLYIGSRSEEIHLYRYQLEHQP